MNLRSFLLFNVFLILFLSFYEDGYHVLAAPSKTKRRAEKNRFKNTIENIDGGEDYVPILECRIEKKDLDKVFLS